MTTKEYIERFLKIRTKDGQVIPFKLNKPQLKFYKILKEQMSKGKGAKIIVLKSRQMGLSTLIQGVMYKMSVTKKNFNVGVVAHLSSASSNLFEMYKRFHSNLPDAIRPETLKSNAKELVFNNKDGTGLGSRVQLFSAESRENLGRSNTFSALHLSEFAFWSDAKNALTALLSTVPDSPNSLVVIESTANGYDFFQEMYSSATQGENSWIPVFIGWHEMDEYRKEIPNDFVLTAEEESLKSLYDLSDEQVYWRRCKIKDDFGGDVASFNQEYPASPEEAFISTGDCVFSKSLIIERLAELRNVEPIKVGRFEYDKEYISREVSVISNIRWVDDANGEIKIHSLPEVAENGAKKPYALGGDTAGEGSDFFTAKVIDNITQKCVATYQKQRTDDDLYADQMYCLGKYYNDAIIGIETNFSVAPTNELERLGYPNLYMREQVDDISKKLVKKYGFNTNRITRPEILANFKALFRECPEIESDKETLREMLTFIRDDNGKEQAMQGKHDDLVMADAIAHFVSKQGDFTWKKEETKTEDNDFMKFFSVNEPKSNGGYIEW